jgi:hypothetical protein
MNRRHRQRHRDAKDNLDAKTNRPPSGKGGGGDGLHFTVWTGVYGGVGLLSATLGFILLAQGSINLAPVLLLIGFLVFFPLALVK